MVRGAITTGAALACSAVVALNVTTVVVLTVLAARAPSTAQLHRAWDAVSPSNASLVLDSLSDVCLPSVPATLSLALPADALVSRGFLVHNLRIILSESGVLTEADVPCVVVQVMERGKRGFPVLWEIWSDLLLTARLWSMWV
jgi:hypothetical protein